VQAVTPDDVADIMRALVAQAKAGDIAAARLVLERVFGRVTDTETLERIEALETAMLECTATGRPDGAGTPGGGRHSVYRRIIPVPVPV
jgi:cobalamin biosynthesis protein CobD/CbiB